MDAEVGAKNESKRENMGSPDEAANGLWMVASRDGDLGKDSVGFAGCGAGGLVLAGPAPQSQKRAERQLGRLAKRIADSAGGCDFCDLLAVDGSLTPARTKKPCGGAGHRLPAR